MTDRYAVIGNPVAHSKSPLIHAQFARQTGEDIEYGRLLAPLDRFAETVAGFRAGGGRGANVTLPFKVEAFRLATTCSARAVTAQAVNTLRFEGDAVYGDNTDGAGLVRDIRDNLGVAISGSRVLLLGAGGAARGVVAPLLDERPADITVANRTVERALELERRSDARLRASSYDALADSSFDIVINATSASVAGALPPLPATVFAGCALAYDMMYGDAAKAFLHAARERGARACADGLGMLVEQAAESFFVWRGVRPQTAAVLASLRSA